MIDEMLTFLARAPTLGDLSLTWGQAGPRLGTGGVYLRGVKVLQTKTDLLGCQKQRCRAEFLLRLCLPPIPLQRDTVSLKCCIAPQAAACLCGPMTSIGPCNKGRPEVSY